MVCSPRYWPQSGYPAHPNAGSADGSKGQRWAGRKDCRKWAWRHRSTMCNKAQRDQSRAQATTSPSPNPQEAPKARAPTCTALRRETESPRGVAAASSAGLMAMRKRWEPVTEALATDL